MRYLIKKATVVDENSKYNGKKVDILFNNGVIEEIRSNIEPIKGVKEIQSPNLHCSISWIDIGTQIGEPGLEHRETISSISAAAKAGGYGAIASFPNTSPVIQSKTAVQFVMEEARKNNFIIYPIAALSQHNEGKEITEMYDLHTSGAIAFGDGLKSIAHTGLLTRAMEYVLPFNGLIIHYPLDHTLTTDAQINEGEMSTLLGMKGSPALAETLIIKRDLELLNYTKSRLCVYGISLSESVKLIKEGKKLNSNLYSTCAYLNLIKTEKELENFDSNLKVSPPLRLKTDVNELIKGLKEGTVDAIVSNHYGIEEEGKQLEFPYAKFGASGIETCFSALNTYAANLDLETLIRSLTSGPRKILNLERGEIKQGFEGGLSLFDTEMEWTFDKTYSLSKNNPFLGERLKGKVIGVLG